MIANPFQLGRRRTIETLHMGLAIDQVNVDIS